MIMAVLTPNHWIVDMDDSKLVSEREKKLHDNVGRSSIQALLLRTRRCAAHARSRPPPLVISFHQLYTLIYFPVQFVHVAQQQGILVLNTQEAEYPGIKVAEREEAHRQDREGGVNGEGGTEEGYRGYVTHNVVESTMCHVVFEPADGDIGRTVICTQDQEIRYAVDKK